MNLLNFETNLMDVKDPVKNAKNLNRVGINQTRCPKCNQPSLPMGQFVDIQRTFQVPIKAWFVSLNLDLTLRLKYCPSCGFLKVEINQ